MKRLFAVLLLVASIGSVGAQQTLAHASLIKATPSVSAILTKKPTAVRLTFDGDLIKIGNANQITVTDASGIVFSTGPTGVSNATASSQLKNLTHFGRYKVSYRVVSNDGHPVSAYYYFYYRKNS